MLSIYNRIQGSIINISPLGLKLAVAGILIGVFTVFSGAAATVSAQEPPVNPLGQTILVTQPVTGSGSTPVPAPPSNQSSTSETEITEPDTTTETNTDPSGSTDEVNFNSSIDSQSVANDTSEATVEANDSQPNPKSYTNFEIRQRAVINLSGELNIIGDNFDQSVPYSATAGEQFSVLSLFPERTGEYRIELTTVNQDDPILWIDGDLQEISDGEYRHQFKNGDADPEFLTLTPDEDALIITLGSVRARLNSCVQFYTPFDAVFELGVDIDGNDVIDQRELVSRQLENQSAACIDTPVSNIPLNSLYTSKVLTPEGNTVALNEGRYDFLNKSSLETKKLARPDVIREFQLKWIRTPVATSVSVKNEYLRPPAEQVISVPQIEEITKDIIQNDADADPSIEYRESEKADQLAADETEDTSTSEFNPLSMVVNNWLWIAGGVGILTAMVMLFQFMKSGTSRSNRS